jgi:hypothetical protein
MQQYLTVNRLLGSWVENVNLSVASTHDAHTPVGGQTSSIDELSFHLRQVFPKFQIAKVILVEFKLEFSIVSNSLSFLQEDLCLDLLDRACYRNEVRSPSRDNSQSSADFPRGVDSGQPQSA